MTVLPEAFKEEMREILGDDYTLYESAVNDEPFRGISVNRLKITPEKLLPLLPFEVRKSPFYRDGYYISAQEQGVGNLPLHLAGAFYVQEPSATSAVSLLDPEPGERVLDLCAAPGGKTAQIASCLKGRGLVWSNEIVKNRAQLLLSNSERMGIANGVISSLHPDILCSNLKGFFHKALVDAPCSGEGMFRKNPEAAAQWSREHVLSCAQRQLSILESASAALTDGGTLVYSTCTFSREENEGVITRFLERHPEFEPYPVASGACRASSLSCAVRITPLEGGEGHFAARLRKKGSLKADIRTKAASSVRDEKLVQDVKKTLLTILDKLPSGNISVIQDKVYILPEDYPQERTVPVIRAGILAGELRKGRFEPSHALFTALPEGAFLRRLDLTDDEKNLSDFLYGMEIGCSGENGYTAVCFNGLVLGFGKCSSGRLKNKYPKGLRQSVAGRYSQE